MSLTVLHSEYNDGNAYSLQDDQGEAAIIPFHDNKISLVGTSSMDKAIQNAFLFANAAELLEVVTDLTAYLRELEEAGFGKVAENSIYLKAINTINKAEGNE